MQCDFNALSLDNIKCLWFSGCAIRLAECQIFQLQGFNNIFCLIILLERMGSQLCPATLESQTTFLGAAIAHPPKLVLHQHEHQISRKPTAIAACLEGRTDPHQSQLILFSSPKDISQPKCESAPSQPSPEETHPQELHQLYSQFQLPDKTLFKGITIAGIPNGHGEEHHPNGQAYVGLFVNGQKNGRGKCTFSNQEEYEGEFKDNMMHGRGTYRFANGDVYVGDFVRNFREGVGRYTPRQPNEQGIEHYEGEYRQNERDGQDVMRYRRGEVLKGIWKQGLLLRAT